MFLPPGTGRGSHQPPLALPLLFGVLLFFTAFTDVTIPHRNGLVKRVSGLFQAPSVNRAASARPTSSPEYWASLRVLPWLPTSISRLPVVRSWL